MTTSARPRNHLPSNVLDPDAAERRRIASEEATSTLRADFEHQLSIFYGLLHPRQIFDCYYPRHTTDAPVMVFLHGGGFPSRLPGPGCLLRATDSPGRRDLRLPRLPTRP